MVLLGPEEDPLAVQSFFWFLPYSEVTELTGAGEKGKKFFSFDQRFVPKDKYSAAEWYYSDEAAGLRAQSDHMVMIRVQNKPFVATERTPEKPDDWLSANIRHTGEETEYPGYIIEPFEAELLFLVVKHFSFFTKVHEWHSLDFGIMRPDEILDMSVVKVTDPDIYNEDEQRSPRRSGPEDIRMGTYEKDTACGTCDLRWHRRFERSCPGHFGHISLEVPIPNYVFLGGNRNPFSASPLLYALNSTCMHCSRLLISTEEGMETLKEKVKAVQESNLLNTAGYDIIRKTVRELINREHTARWSEIGIKKKDVPKNITCPHCEKVSPQVTFHLSYSDGLQYVFAPKKAIFDPETEKAVFYPYKQVHDWLQDISEEDASALGFSAGSRPQDMFFTTLPVIPNTARPPAQTPGGGLVPNDLSELYSTIVKINNRIKRDRAASAQVERLSKSLFQAVGQLQTGQKSALGSGGMRAAMTKAGAAPQNLRGIFDRIIGVGRQKNTIRRQHQGKVDEGVAYSVITPDPALDIDEVGVPYTVCAELTIEETVTEENIEFLRQCVLNGAQTPVHRGQTYKDFDSSRYPGAHSMRVNGENYDLFLKDVPEKWRETRRRYQAEILEPGATVVRNLVKGDIVLFTRAPALHRQSMVAFKVVPVKTRSLSFNPSVCIPFNADYDGDAMRIFALQSKEAIEEAKNNMMPSHQMLHTRYGRTFITFDQDEISGSYLLTFKNKEAGSGIHPDERSGWGFDADGHPILSRHRALNLLSRAFVRNEEGIDYMTMLPKPISRGDFKGCYRGRDIVSMFIPDGINARYTARDKETAVVIEDGVVKEGVLDEKFFGTKAGVLAASFVYRFGWEEGHRQMERMTNLLSRVVFAAHIEYGFTLGINDISFSSRNPEFVGPDDENYWKGSAVGRFYDELDTKFQEMSKAIHQIELHFRDKELEKITGPNGEKINMKVALKDPLMAKEQIVQKYTDEYEKFCLNAVTDIQTSTNAMNITVNSGGRGNLSQLQQMGASYGQHKLTGAGRPRHGISSDRVLAHFAKGEFSAEANGFINECYARGLGPTSFWFASTAGRRKLMESSQGGIQVSGYMEHRMKRGMENLMIDSKQRVIDLRTNSVVSFLVGGDGMRAFHARGPDNDKSGLSLSLQPMLLEYSCEHDVKLADTCSLCDSGKSSRVDFGFLPKNLEQHVLKAIEGRKIDRSTSAGMKKSMKAYFEDSLSLPGEMIGSTTGANLGEPATQAGLRAFHGGGKGSVPTVDRLIHYLDLKRKEQQQPNTTVYLKSAFNTKENAERLANFCTGLRLSEIIDSVEYDTEEYQITIRFDRGYTELFSVDYNWIAHTLRKTMKSEGREVLEVNEEGAVIQCHGDYRDLLVAKETLSAIPISGIRDAELALVVKNKDNERWGIQINGPIKGGDGLTTNTFWQDIEGLLGKYVDLSLTDFSDSWMVYTIMGLEAALMHLTQMVWGQMNGQFESKGLGDLDYRYIRTITDYMGIFGRPIGLSKYGHMVKYNRSVLAAMGGEDPWMSLIPGSVMGNHDKLLGPVEAITAGKGLTIGSLYREMNREDNA